MKPKLLRVEAPVVQFGPLIAAVRQNGGRVGWLDVAPNAAPEAPGPVPKDLEVAAEQGVLRAVAVGGGRSVVLKPMRGEPVLRDLLREHFRGCVLVLVRGELPNQERDVAELVPAGQDTATDHWTITRPDHPPRRFTLEELVKALRRPRPWGRDEPAGEASIP